MDLPIACTLDAAQMSKRVATIAALLTDALVDQSEIDGGVRTRFHDASAISSKPNRSAAPSSASTSAETTAYSGSTSPAHPKHDR